LNRTEANPLVQFYGYVYARTGYGTAARGYVHAMDEAGIDLSVVSLDSKPKPGAAGARMEQLRNRPEEPALHVWHTEPNHVMRLGFNDERLVVLTTWEADRLPPCYVDALNHAGEVWVPCRYNQQQFQQQLSVPVYAVPHAVNQLAAPRYNREEFDREMNVPPGTFVFLAMGTWQERKNLDGAIEAFLRAFPTEDDVQLFVKTAFFFTNEAIVRREIMEAIRRSGVANPDQLEKRVRIFPVHWPEDCVSALMNRADCVVSLHRGEGWGYTLFDAACMGKPTISTAYSGPLDYLDPHLHRLVDYKLTHADQRKHTIRFAFDQSMQWADPDMEHAAAQMRTVYEQRTLANAQAEQAAVVLRERYAPRAIGQQIQKRMMARIGTCDASHPAQSNNLGVPRRLPLTEPRKTQPAGNTLATKSGTASGSALQPTFCS